MAKELKHSARVIIDSLLREEYSVEQSNLSNSMKIAFLASMHICAYQSKGCDYNVSRLAEWVIKNVYMTHPSQNHLDNVERILPLIKATGKQPAHKFFTPQLPPREVVEREKRKGGRPKGSGGTPWVRRTAIEKDQLTDEQQALIKYIKRTDKPATNKRLEGVTHSLERLEDLNTPIGIINECRTYVRATEQANVAWHEQRAKRLQEQMAIDSEKAALKAEARLAKEEERLRKKFLREQQQAERQAQRDQKELLRKQKEEIRQKEKEARLLAKMKIEEELRQKKEEQKQHEQELKETFEDNGRIKDLTPIFFDGVRSQYISERSANIFSKRFPYIDEPVQFLRTDLPDMQKLAARVAYEMWIIHYLSPDTDLNALARSLARLYYHYYKNLAEKAEQGAEDVLDLFDKITHKTIQAVFNFYNLIPADAKPKVTELKKKLFFKVFEMPEWNYTFDFLYPGKLVRNGNAELICIYHGTVKKTLKKKEKMLCEQCFADQQQKFKDVQQAQIEAAQNNERDEFISKSREIHGDKYDYSLVEYVNTNRPVNIRCKKHDFVFPMSPRDHLNGRGCKLCANNQKKTTEQFNEEMQEIYGGNLVCEEYTDTRTSAKMYCKKHDHHFIRMPGHLQKGYGCPICNKEEGKTWANTVTAKYDPSRKTEAGTNESFIEKSRKRHGDHYDYTHVKYVNNDTPVCIVCKGCNEIHWMSPDAHLRSPSGGCNKCWGKTGRSPERKMQDFIVEANRIHNNRYVYLDKEYNPNVAHIYCHIHRDFTLKPSDHLKGLGCPHCFPKQSLRTGISEGERRVIKHLKARNIPYIYNKEIKNEYGISNRQVFRPDFQLLAHNAIIEFNGEQHYRYVEGIHADYNAFIQQQLRDVEMRQYCHDHNIRLLEIRYDEIDNIPELIDNFL